MFNFEKLTFTDAEIDEVESRFGFAFNQEQREVIRYFKSSDIQACPGSGKTTTLAAKLILIARGLPNNFSRGICVITHTNIAVKEIQHKLGEYSAFFHRYPNHFGTIQSFVDKYLAIPAYKNLFKQSPRIVDDSTFERELRNLSILSKTGTLALLDFKNESVSSLSFNKFDFSISRGINNKSPYEIPGISREKAAIHLTRIQIAKRKLLEFGYLKYDEAYSMGFKYLRENPEILDAFSYRFPLIFVDEMQDMEIHQAEIIRSILQGNNTIIQRIGDINQSIYSGSVHESEQWTPSNTLNVQLKKSLRISDNIASLVKDLCLIPQEMEGWNNPTPIKPTIIVYNDPLKVKDKFGELLFQHNLPKNGVYKCIGSRIGESRLNINSYWPEFNKLREKDEFPTLRSHLAYITKIAKNTKNSRKLFRELLEIFCKACKLCRIKNPETMTYFTPTTFYKYHSILQIPIFPNMNSILANWIMCIYNGTELHQSLSSQIDSCIKGFGETMSDELKYFISNMDMLDGETNANSSTYQFVSGDETRDLQFDTIHGIKGETHTATLYLETYNRLYDVGGKILKFICSSEQQRKKLRKEDATRKKLPHAYVALTRATHFVCIAVDKSRFESSFADYFETNKNSWQVEYT